MTTRAQRRRNLRAGLIIGVLALGLYVGFFAYRYALLGHGA